MRPDEHDFNDDESEPGPSRSALRRQALDVLKLAGTLADMSDAQLDALPLDDDLRDEVRRTRAVRSQIARKRQTQFLAKQLRKADDTMLEAVRAALSHDKDIARRDAAALHRLEQWRDRLVAEGDDALGDLLALYPHADRQQLRQLARQATVERERGKPPHASRELFRVLRELAETQVDATDDDVIGDADAPGDSDTRDA